MLLLSIILLTVAYLLELSSYSKLYNSLVLRLTIATASMLIVIVFSLLLVIYLQNLLSMIVLFFSIYRIINILRLFYKQHDFLAIASRCKRASFKLWMYQLGAVAIIGGFNNLITNLSFKLYIVAIILLMASLIIVLSILKHQQNIKKITSDPILPLVDCPTLTVAIPARNETDALNNCLMSLLACDYPKLEILVLDDRSTNAKTGDIIKSFAQSGVIFLAGRKVSKGWLPKNWAYQQLIEAANGELILFCGADTLFDRQSIKLLVSAMINRNKQMVSIIPNNHMPKSYINRLYQPIRYAWEVSFPRRLIHRPPVLSTCWLTRASFIHQYGGFNAIKKNVVCETYFAKAATKNDSYSFFQFNGVVSDKPVADLLETALRLRYPQLKKALDKLALLSLVELCLIIGPIYLFIDSIFRFDIGILIISSLAIILFTTAVAQVIALTYRRKVYDALYYWPLFILLDFIIIHWSMFKYDFSYVLWKGRRIDS